MNFAFIKSASAVTVAIFFFLFELSKALMKKEYPRNAWFTFLVHKFELSFTRIPALLLLFSLLFVVRILLIINYSTTPSYPPETQFPFLIAF